MCKIVSNDILIVDILCEMFYVFMYVRRKSRYKEDNIKRICDIPFHYILFQENICLQNNNRVATSS